MWKEPAKNGQASGERKSSSGWNERELGGGKGVRMAQEMTSDPEGSVRSESLAEGRAEWEQRIKKEMRMECQIDFKWGHMLHQWP